MVNLATLVSITDSLKSMVSFDFDDVFIPEIFSCFIIAIILIILFVAIKISSVKALKNPLKAPKGLFSLACFGVEKVESYVVSIMGEKNRGFAKYILPLMIYVFMCFTFGLTGLASPMTYLGVPLSLSLVTFLLIHIQAIKTNKWGYFKRYIEPFPVFLPINLVTMWTPLISLSLRMFANAISGYCLMGIVYWGLENIGTAILNAHPTNFPGPEGLMFSWVGTPILHAYFDLFSGGVQTLVFSMLTMINILQEQNEEEPEVIVEKVLYQ